MRAVEPLERRDLFRTLDPFCDRLHPEVVCELHDRRRHHPLLRASTKPADERLVDLEDVDRKTLEVAERRVPCPEVVESEADADAPELAETREHGVGILDEAALRQLEHELLGR